MACSDSARQRSRSRWPSLARRRLCPTRLWEADVLVYEGSSRTWSSLRERVTFELSCSDAEIDVKIFNPRLYGVTGCGKKMVYKYVSSVGGIIADTAQGTNTPPTSDDDSEDLADLVSPSMLYRSGRVVISDPCRPRMRSWIRILVFPILWAGCRP